MNKPRRDLPAATRTTRTLTAPGLARATGGAGDIKANVISEPAGPDNVVRR